MTGVYGDCDDAFAVVRRDFADVVSTSCAGSALTVWHDGRTVVDLWGGAASSSPSRAWARDTLVMPYSVSTPFSAVCVLLLVERGQLALDTSVRQVWPELTWDASVRQVLAHTAGLVLLDSPAPREAFLDWGDLCARIARQRPSWAPGSALGESALFYGHLLGELVRRVDGRSLGAYFREEICAPAQLDLHVGLTAPDLGRVADLVVTDRLLEPSGGPLRERALANPPGSTDMSWVNSRAWRMAEVPAVNAHVTARSVADFYALLARGRILGPELLAEMTRVQAAGPDAVTGQDTRWGLGVSIEPDGWGMGGTGGSLGWWSREGSYGFAYVTAEVGDHDRSARLENSLRAVLGLPPV